jgi:hypothetical protein
VNAAGIDGPWTPRELRHTFVSLMSDSGVPVEEIARLAGHTSSRTTEIVYRHQLRPFMENGALAMDQLFAPHRLRSSATERMIMRSLGCLLGGRSSPEIAANGTPRRHGHELEPGLGHSWVGRSRSITGKIARHAH